MRTDLFSAATDSSVTLWWDQPDQAPFPARYAVLIGGRPAGVTERTHFTAEGLSPDTAYCFQVCLGGELIGEAAVRTAKPPRRIDVTQAPYRAVGDGAALNTQALQRALDDCGPGEEVYIPSGVFLTGGLRLHSDMSLYLAEGAVLQGTENPEDYLPKIPSRFEGVEDVRIWDCDLRHSLYGVQIKGTQKRGGYVRSVSVRDSVLPRFVVQAVPYNDDGEGSDTPPDFSGFRCERVRFTGWGRNYWEKEDRPLAVIDLTGFDTTGYEVRNAAFLRCVSERDAEIRLNRCRNITIDLEKTE